MKKRAAYVLCAVLIGSATVAFAASPGSAEDPLITKSYLDSVLLPQIYSYIDQAVSALTPAAPTGSSEAFQVVTVGAGQKVTGGEGCELILRMGSATVVGSMRGGLADTTAGTDLSDAAPVPPNHMLIVPLADGRGVRVGANEDCIFMIKGTYTISQ